MPNRILSTIILTAILILGGCVNDTPPEALSLVGVGDTLPSVELTLSDGSTLSSGNLAGEPAVVALFTTTCPDCRRLLPELEEIHRQHPDLRMLLISRNESASRIEEYWKENDLTLPYCAQPDDRVYRLFATGGVPWVYVVDKETRVTALWGDHPLPTASQILSALELVP